MTACAFCLVLQTWPFLARKTKPVSFLTSLVEGNFEHVDVYAMETYGGVKV